MARQEEAERKEKRNPKHRDNEIRGEGQIGDRDVRIKPHVTSSRERYDNRPRVNHPKIGLRKDHGRIAMGPQL